MPVREERTLPISNRHFSVGRDREGHWLALESTGRSGGIFASRQAAVHYATMETERRPGAVRVLDQPLELEI